MRKKILYLITEDWFFESHFLERALAAYDKGFDVYVATKLNNVSRFNSTGKLKIIPINFSRSGINPFVDFFTLIKIIAIYKKITPDVVHHVAMKPIIYGTLSVLISGIKAKIINAPVGMGYVFTSGDFKAMLLRPLVHQLLRWTLNPKNSKVIFENPDDLYDAVKRKLVKRKDANLIPGAGVDVSLFIPKPAKNITPVVTLVARMLIDKGVHEFIGAAKIINESDISVIFLLVGDPDDLNPSSLTRSYLESVSGTYGLKWLGYSNDIAKIYQNSDIACLPSYREGLPKSLIEAAACGLPIVTTDAVGCREVVNDGENGFLVPIKSSEAIAKAIKLILSDADIFISMGIKSRKLAVEKFSSGLIIEQTMAIYN